MKYDINTVSDVIDCLGGPTELGARLGITQEAVSNWKARGYIPNGWHLKLVVWLGGTGRSVDPELFDMPDVDVAASVPKPNGMDACA